MVHFGPYIEEVHFGPFGSANRTLAIPENRRDFKSLRFQIASGLDVESLAIWASKAHCMLSFENGPCQDDRAAGEGGECTIIWPGLLPDLRAYQGWARFFFLPFFVPDTGK